MSLLLMIMKATKSRCPHFQLAFEDYHVDDSGPIFGKSGPLEQDNILFGL